MSLILDALKKSEKERQAEPEAQVTPQAPWEVDAEKSRPRRLWPWLAVAILIVLGGTGGVLYLRTGSVPPPAREVATAESPTVAPAVGPASQQPAEPVDGAQGKPVEATEPASEPQSEQPADPVKQAETEGSLRPQEEKPEVTEDAVVPAEPAPAPQPEEAATRTEDQPLSGHL